MNQRQMGICNSCESTAVITSKLILQDGQLQQFSNPVKVSHVLQDSPMYFICDSDDMEFGGFVTAVNGDADLQLGQLYFVLPLCWLNKPLRAEQMAALAVRASLAFRNMRRSKRFRGCGRKGINEYQVVFTTKTGVTPSRMAAIDSCGGSWGGHQEVARKRRGRSGSARSRRGGGGSFMTSLSVILEDDSGLET